MCMYDGSCAPSSFYETTRQATKDQRCGDCWRTIAKGERYVFVSGGWEGQYDVLVLCEQCDAAKEWLVVACSGFMYGAIEEDLGEHVTGDESDLRSAPLTRLYRWMRAKWRNRAGELRPVEDVEAVTSRAIAAYREQYAKAVA